MIRRLFRAWCRWFTGHSPTSWSPWRDLGDYRFEHTRSCAVCGFEETEIDG